MRYHAGAGSELPFKTICAAPVRNDSFAPQMQTILSAQIRKNLLRCPGIKLSDAADVTLTATIADFGQSTATTMPHDSVRAKSFTLSIRAECSLFDNRTGEYLFKNQSVEASIDSQAEGDYHWNKTQVIPKLSMKLAEKICDMVRAPW
jgi:hypothetical protein